MSWRNIQLIFLRELRDQLRDRRTLFTILVLPLLLYPLLGMSFLQISQFMREHPTRICLIGTEHLPREPHLLQDGKFSELLCSEHDAELLTLVLRNELPKEYATDVKAFAQKEIRGGHYDAIVYFPPAFGEELTKFRAQLQELHDTDSPALMASMAKIPKPEIYADNAHDKSRIASDRVQRVLQQWRSEIVQQNLRQSNVPVEATAPFDLTGTDIAEEVSRRAAMWSKILPFVVLVWALTGAFYPAIDLCAGEKERGTLETLLCSPAQRSEIVWGKLLTVMTFSISTSLLNLFSMALTGSFITGQLEQMQAGGAQSLGHPPLASLGWLVLALIPIAALFSALSLAVAAFARSSKEGQYYLMPLLLVSLPLMMLPMLPAAELDLGMGLIPITGMMLLLRSLVEGHYMEALIFAPPVLGVTAGCCLLAIRWAIDQFNNESVLFRESERWDVSLWLRHLLRDRDFTPTAGQAILCGIILLLIRFFASFAMDPKATESWSGFAQMVLVTQIALIATPVILMTIMLTRSVRKTLHLDLPHPLAIPAAIALAVLLHPSAIMLTEFIQQLYPMKSEMLRELTKGQAVMAQAPSLWHILGLMALLPAICEELAFRGFILSGLRHVGHKWVAILLSAVFFGALHGILQQSLAASVLGVVLGFVAVQSSSLLTAVVFHATYNSLSMLLVLRAPDWLEKIPGLQPIFRSETLPNGKLDIGYTSAYTLATFIVAVAILYWFRRLPYQASAEECLQDALDRQSTNTQLIAAK